VGTTVGMDVPGHASRKPAPNAVARRYWAEVYAGVVVYDGERPRRKARAVRVRTVAGRAERRCR
jgi:hypothetical protein